MEKTVTKTIVIQRGVPLPDRRGYRGESTTWTKLAEQMTEGDSVLLDAEKQAASLGVALRKRGWRPSQRQEGGRWRVWCVERKTYKDTDIKFREIRTNGHAGA